MLPTPPIEGGGFPIGARWGERSGFIPTSLISLPPSFCNLYLCLSLDLIYQGFSHSSRKTAGRGFLCKAFELAGILFSRVMPGWFLQGGSQLSKA